MFSVIWSFFGSKEEPVPTPPPVTITGVRIPADGTPAHLLSLTTTTDPNNGTDGFLFHIPDLRQYWKADEAGWSYRDICRLDLYPHDAQPFHLLPSYLHQMDHLKQLLYPGGVRDRRRLLHLDQRYLLDQHYQFLQPHQSSCVGTYYVFYSFASGLPENLFVPDWVRGTHWKRFRGDVFLVKISPQEYDENEWAVYEDINLDFLEFLANGPCNNRRVRI